MRKEMIVSSSPHETKIAVLEEDQVVEVYFEREKEYTLAGSIYKGRVTRVLPGMQSAFVDIGLERDAFLYVSDFLEDAEEYEKIVSTVEEKVMKIEEGRQGETAVAAAAVVPSEAPAELPPEPPPARRVAEDLHAEKAPAGHGHHFTRGSRRHRPRHKGFPETKYARHVPAPPPPAGPPVSGTAPVILPGESLAKYKDWQAGSGVPQVLPVEPVSAEAAEAVAESLEALAVPPPTAVVETPTQEEQAADRGEETTEVREAEQEGEAQEFSSVEPAAPQETAGPILPEQAQQEPTAPAFPPEQEPPMVEPPEVAAAAVEFGATRPEELPPAAAEPSPSSHEEVLSPSETGLAEPGAGEVGISESVAGETEEAAEGAVAPEDTERKEPVEVRPAPQQAAVREGPRNPRYQRRGRWVARRPSPPEPAYRGSQPREREAPRPLIADLLKEGQEIIVQIAKEPLGKKGARITSHIALPGRYLVYMPTIDHVGVSRKIASEEERQRLKRILLGLARDLPGGFIVRTAGEGHSEEDFRQDVVYLSKLWADIKGQAEKAKAPVLLHHDLNLVLRTLRDQLSEDFTTIWVDNEQEYERILDLVSKSQPALVSRVKLYTKDVPLFEELAIQEEINKALKPKIWLKSGGYIVINQTEALVAIDVNTGKFVGKSNRLEDTIVKTNVDAIQEIVRQIRLRDLGGIIVIDFIDMDERKNRQKVMVALEEALKADRAPSKSLSFNEFGLVAITRKRVRQSLERTLCQPCPDCNGSGYIKSVATVCLEILAEARKLASELGGRQITLRVHPEVGKALKARDNTVVPEIEEMTGKTVIIRNDPTLHLENYDFD